MPNTPAAVDCGMTGLCRGAHAGPEHLEMARAMFDAVGRTVAVDEKNMDAVTGLSASGPAFAYIILESLAEAGVKVGLPRDVATLLAAQTMKGAASVVLETGDHPALLKDAVTTPAGCTIDGIMELEEGKLRVTLIKAVVKATSRAGELLFKKYAGARLTLVVAGSLRGSDAERVHSSVDLRSAGDSVSRRDTDAGKIYSAGLHLRRREAQALRVRDPSGERFTRAILRAVLHCGHVVCDLRRRGDVPNSVGDSVPRMGRCASRAIRAGLNGTVPRNPPCWLFVAL